EPEAFPLHASAELVKELEQPLPSASPAVADKRLRGEALEKRKREEPDGPSEGKVAGAGPLNQRLGWRLVEHYRRLIKQHEIGTRRGLEVVAKRSGKQAVTGLPAYGEALLPAALRRRLKALAPESLLVVPDGALHRLPLEALLLATDPGP